MIPYKVPGGFPKLLLVAQLESPGLEGQSLSMSSTTCPAGYIQLLNQVNITEIGIIFITISIIIL